MTSSPTRSGIPSVEFRLKQRVALSGPCSTVVPVTAREQSAVAKVSLMRKNYDLEVLNYELRASRLSPRIPSISEPRMESKRPSPKPISDFEVLNYELLALARSNSPNTFSRSRIKTENINSFESFTESKVEGIVRTVSGDSNHAEQRIASLCDITNQRTIQNPEIDFQSARCCGS